MALPSLTLRNTKGSALTYTEADNNFTNLSTATIGVIVGSTTTSLSLNDTITFSTGTGMTITANSSTKTITFASSGGSGGIAAVKEDTTPRLGGDLDVQTFAIVTTASNRSITITPNGTGLVIMNSNEIRVGDVDASVAVTSQGNGNLVLSTNYNSGSSGNITIKQGLNADIDLVPNGTGDVTLQADITRIGDVNATATLTTWGTGDLVLNTNTGTNSGSITIGAGASGNITIAADGTGDIHLNSNAVRVGRNNSTVAELATAGTTPLKIYPNEGSSTQPFINLAEGVNGAITIASTGTGNINLTTATGSVIIAGTTWPSSKGTSGYLLQTNGSGTASWVSTSTLGIPASYTLTTATSAALGGVKIGSGLSAAVDGTIAVTAVPSTGVTSINFGSTGLTPSSATTGTVLVSGVLNVANGGLGTSEVAGVGRIPIGNGANYVPAFPTAGSGIAVTTASGAITIASTTATAAAIGAVKIGSGISITGDGTISASGGADTVFAYTFSATFAPTFSNGAIQTTTVTANITSLAFTSPTSGQTITIVATQDATGNRTLPASSGTLKYANGVKTLSGPNGIDIITISYIGTVYYVSITRGYA